MIRELEPGELIELYDPINKLLIGGKVKVAGLQIARVSPVKQAQLSATILQVIQFELHSKIYTIWYKHNWYLFHHQNILNNKNKLSHLKFSETRSHRKCKYLYPSNLNISGSKLRNRWLNTLTYTIRSTLKISLITGANIYRIFEISWVTSANTPIKCSSIESLTWSTSVCIRTIWT